MTPTQELRALRFANTVHNVVSGLASLVAVGLGLSLIVVTYVIYLTTLN